METLSKRPIGPEPEQISVMRKKIEHATDGLGKGLDKGMIEPCILLNALGFHTRQSCDGHGESFPWVDFLTETEKQEEDLESAGQGIRNKVTKDSARIADAIDPERKDSSWVTHYSNALHAHPEAAEWQRIEDKIREETIDLQL
jgi:hypothetical protein